MSMTLALSLELTSGLSVTTYALFRLLLFYFYVCLCLSPENCSMPVSLLLLLEWQHLQLKYTSRSAQKQNRAVSLMVLLFMQRIDS